MLAWWSRQSMFYPSTSRCTKYMYGPDTAPRRSTVNLHCTLCWALCFLSRSMCGVLLYCRWWIWWWPTGQVLYLLNNHNYHFQHMNSSNVKLLFVRTFCQNISFFDFIVLLISLDLLWIDVNRNYIYTQFHQRIWILKNGVQSIQNQTLFRE